MAFERWRGLEKQLRAEMTMEVRQMEPEGFVSSLHHRDAVNTGEKFFACFFATPVIRAVLKKLEDKVRREELHPSVASWVFAQFRDNLEGRIAEKLRRKSDGERILSLFRGTSKERPLGLHEMFGSRIFDDLGVDTRNEVEDCEMEFGDEEPRNHVQLTIGNGKVTTKIFHAK